MAERPTRPDATKERNLRILIVGGIALAIAMALVVAGRSNRPDLVTADAPNRSSVPSGVKKFGGLS